MAQEEGKGPSSQMMENHANNFPQSKLQKALPAGAVHGQARGFTSINDSTKKKWSPLKHSAPLLEVLGNALNSPVSAFPSLGKNPLCSYKPGGIL